ncbi:MAG: hypothetical protein RL095_1743 [Verrucomicrobiota bacterium]|jgi:hypothetical protein
MECSVPQQLLARLASLRAERSLFEADWRSLAEFILPRNGRWLESQTNKPQPKSNKILNTRATLDMRSLAAGLAAGVSSKARPWFHLGTPSKKLNKREDVKIWLFEVESILREAMNRSNFYSSMHQLYEELGLFGCSAMILDEHEEKTVHCRTLTAGEFFFALGADDTVNSLYRTLQMTVAQLVERFTLAACSPPVQQAWREHQHDRQVKVLHVIEPNDLRDWNSPGPAGMAWRSAWMELEGHCDKFLKLSGYHSKPFIAPRWHVLGGDAYGRGPGHDILPDVQSLQTMEKWKAKAVAKKVDPPLLGPSSLKNQVINNVPGGVTYVDLTNSPNGFRSVYDVQLQTGELRQDIAEMEARIRSGLFVDLFLMISNDQRSDITAAEIAARQEEKMMMIGPVLERLHDEALGPAIDRIFETCQRDGKLPPPPPDLNGVELQVEYISILAQAQKALATRGIERTIGFVGNLAQSNPAVLDKLDCDAAVDAYVDAIGTPPMLIRSADAVAAIRQQRQDALDQQAQREQLMQAAQGAELLSKTDTRSGNALNALLTGRLT